MTEFYNKYKNTILTLLSGLLIGISYKYFVFYLAWICLVPLFLLLEKKSKKQAFVYGYLVGFIVSLFLFMWMYSLAKDYTGTDTQSGILFILLSSLYFSFWFGAFSWFYVWITKPSEKNLKKNKKKKNIQKQSFSKRIVAKSLAVASLWTLFEWVNVQLLPGLPWLDTIISCTQSTNLFIIQPAAIGGIWIVGFIAVLVNYLLYASLTDRKYKPAVFAGIILLAVHLYGFLAIYFIEHGEKHFKIKVSVLTENVLSDMRWADQTGDSLENVFYELNKEAVTQNPDLIIWTETAVPWAFEIDNDFIINALQITSSSQACHLMGLIMPDAKDSTITYNSACFFQPDGAITARYDKQELLSFIESPLISSDWKLPFISSGDINKLHSSNFSLPLNTHKGKIGTMICNESLIPYTAREHCLQNAEYFVLMSNDSWFERNELDFQHFYLSRFRAVENRRDIVINSNRGYSGKISASGKIESLYKSGNYHTWSENVTVRKKKSTYTKNGDFFVIISFLYLLTYITLIKLRNNY